MDGAPVAVVAQRRRWRSCGGGVDAAVARRWRWRGCGGAVDVMATEHLQFICHRWQMLRVSLQLERLTLDNDWHSRKCWSLEDIFNVY